MGLLKKKPCASVELPNGTNLFNLGLGKEDSRVRASHLEVSSEDMAFRPYRASSIYIYIY